MSTAVGKGTLVAALVSFSGADAHAAGRPRALSQPTHYLRS